MVRLQACQSLSYDMNSLSLSSERASERIVIWFRSTWYEHLSVWLSRLCCLDSCTPWLPRSKCKCSSIRRGSPRKVYCETTPTKSTSHPTSSWGRFWRQECRWFPWDLSTFSFHLWICFCFWMLDFGCFKIWIHDNHPSHHVFPLI